MGMEERRKALMQAGPQWGMQWTTAPQTPAFESPHRAAYTNLPCESCKSPAMGSIVDPQPTTRQFTCKNWPSFDDIISQPGFRAVPRISALDPNLLKHIEQHEANGVPLVVEGFHKLPSWQPDIFNPTWLASHGQREISVRNVCSGEDRVMEMSEFIGVSRSMPEFAEPDEKERLYGKDAPCPPEWNENLHCGSIPRRLLPDSQSNLLNNLPEIKRVETLMCYIGVSDTYTAIHKDLCGSFGHNLMCYTEDNGSSLWLMTESSSARRLTDHFLTTNQVLDHETYVMTVEAAAAAAKEANVTIVCRPETYRVKATIYHTLQRWTKELREQNKNTNLAKNLTTVTALYDSILRAEYCSQHQIMDTIKSNSADPDLQCDFCGADVFQSFFYCKGCVQEQTKVIEDSFILCPGCYIEGRTCKCGTLKPGQLRPFSDLLAARTASHAVLRHFWNTNKAIQATPLTPEKELLDSASKSGVFSACMILAENRKSIGPKDSLNRKCSPTSSEPSHEDFSADARFYCKECHRTLCFKHLLSLFGLHSMFALHAHRQGILHAKHIGNKRRYQEKATPYAEQEKRGSMPDEDFQLSDLALVYDVCKPLHPLFCQPGWYDKNVTVIRGLEEFPSHLEARYKITATNGHDSPTKSSVRVSKSVERPKKRKRKAWVLDCVLISSPVPLDEADVRVSREVVTSKRIRAGVDDDAGSSKHNRTFVGPSLSKQKRMASKADPQTERRRKRPKIALDDPTSCGPSFNSELARAIDSSAINSATPQVAGPSPEMMKTGKARGKTSSQGTTTSTQNQALPVARLPSTGDRQMRLPGFLGPSTVQSSPADDFGDGARGLSPSTSTKPQPSGPSEPSELDELKQEFALLKREFDELKRKNTPVVVYVQSPDQVATFASSSHTDHENMAGIGFSHQETYHRHVRQSPSEIGHIKTRKSSTPARQDRPRPGSSAPRRRQNSLREGHSSLTPETIRARGAGSRVQTPSDERAGITKYKRGQSSFQHEDTHSRPKFGQARASTSALVGYETDELAIHESPATLRSKGG
ncbi:hypothetical protein AAF712_009302 [Marasmius tenuissimus]|uniref:JmjC domain-containing protein n=1 Tax=Marasmius tenuissimus TaxID=585030 RepID=A0ABR2ZQZ8_9AGAR